MPNPIASIRDYLKSSVAELRKVTWPSRDMTVRYAALVIIVSVALAGFFAALDFGLSRVVTAALQNRTAPAEQPALPDIQPTVDATSSAAAPASPAAPAPADNGGLQLPPLETPKP